MSLAHGRKEYIEHDDADARTWDFQQARNLHKTTTILESIAHLIKGCLGAGMLGIHQAFMKAGLWTALVLNLCFGFYLSYCIHILVKSAQMLYHRLHIPAMSYSDLAEVSLGSCKFPFLRKFDFTFRVMVDIIICIDLFGSCCCYEIFIGQTVKQLVEQVPEAPIHGIGSSPHLAVYIILIAIPILAICMIRNLKYLAPFSIVGDCLILLSVGTAVYYASQFAGPLGDMPAWKNWGGLTEFMGVSVFSMEGVGVSLAIENNMKEPLKFPIVLMGGMFCVISVVTLTGFVGYWGWGEHCLPSITLNFPIQDILPLCVKGSMAIVIFITFALNFWVPFNIVWYYLKKKHPEEKHWLWERIYRATHVLIVTILAAAFPNMGNFMGLLGSLCLSNMGFIFPAIIETVVIWDKPGLGPGKWRLWVNVFIIILGTVFCVCGTYVNARALFFG